jgi:uncharacterized phiE125 gp8 family phage protein
VTGWDRLTRVTAPAAPPLTRDEVKAHLKVDTDYENAVLDALIAGAVATVDGPRGIGICMMKQTWRLTLDRFTRFITIPLGPNVEVTSVKYDDTDGAEQTLDPSGYRLAAGLDPAVLSPTDGSSWPVVLCQPGSVRIEFTAGYGETSAEVPADLVNALKLVVGSLHEDREAGAVPPAAQAVFDRYGVLGVA